MAAPYWAADQNKAVTLGEGSEVAAPRTGAELWAKARLLLTYLPHYSQFTTNNLLLTIDY